MNFARGLEWIGAEAERWQVLAIDRRVKTKAGHILSKGINLKPCFKLEAIRGKGHGRIEKTNQPQATENDPEIEFKRTQDVVSLIK